MSADIDIDALEDRMQRAVVELENLAETGHALPVTSTHLRGKAQGVELALSYLQEARRLADKK